MRKPAKKYFSPSLGTKSIMQMRRWMDSGAKAADIVRWIKTEYAKAKDDRTKEHLGLMLATAMSVSDSFSGRLLAQKCARMFDMPLVKDSSIGEVAILSMAIINGCNHLEWPETFNPYFAKNCRLPSDMAPKEIVTKALSPSDHRNLVTVDARNSIYFMRDAHGYAWLIAVNHCNTDILIDEETFHCDPPLYFTESKHFISPVWILKQAADILEYILMVVGFPPMKIYKRVIFDSQDANLINEDIYLASDEWEDVDVVTLHKTDGKVFPAPAIPVVESGSEPFGTSQNLKTMLYLGVMATAAVLEAFDITKHWEITRSMIEDWCKKSCIFPPADWGEIYKKESDDDDSIF